MLVTLDDMKTRLNITDSDSDAYLTQQIEAATALIENYCAREFELLETTQFIRNPNQTLNLTRFPIDDITSIITSRGYTVLEQNYTVEHDLGRVYWSMNGGRWMNDELIEVLFTGGFDEIPADIQEVVFDIVSGRYYSQGTNPSQQVKSESVDGIGKTEFVVNSSYYGTAGGYGGFNLNQYAGVLDLYRLEGAIAI